MKKALYLVLFGVLGGLVGFIIYIATQYVLLGFLVAEYGTAGVSFFSTSGVLVAVFFWMLLVGGFFAGVQQGYICFDDVYGYRVIGKVRRGHVARLSLYGSLIICIILLALSADSFGFITKLKDFSRDETLKDTKDASLPATGIRGVITVGPICPSERTREAGATSSKECSDRPYETEIAVYRGDTVVKVISSSGSGTFEALLDPGEYFVGPLPGVTAPPTFKKMKVEVSSAGFLELQIRFESGVSREAASKIKR